MYKIINYVSSTGEVTLYGKTQYIPTIQTLYQVFKRNSSNTYDYVTGVRINYSAPDDIVREGIKIIAELYKAWS